MPDDFDQVYDVNLLSQSCTCPDHQFRKVKCKHIRVAEKKLALMTEPFRRTENDLIDRSLLLEC